IAHAAMLHAQGLLTSEDFIAIRAGLTALAEEHARGAWRIEPADEDGQTALERRLTERIGAAGARIHLGRSRNDQVLTAIRLYLREAVAALASGALEVAEALDELASREQDTALPGYTHQQQAMPSSVPLWAGGFAAELRDDAAGLSGVRRRIDKSPSGYHRDLQLLKFPLFRGIDLALATLAILPPAIGALQFRREAIRLDPAIHAAEEANRLVVTEGIPFREAYRRVAAKLKR